MWLKIQKTKQFIMISGRAEILRLERFLKYQEAKFLWEELSMSGRYRIVNVIGINSTMKVIKGHKSVILLTIIIV